MERFTIDQLRARHSVRTYSAKPIEEGEIRSLQSEVTLINTHEAGLNFQLMIGNEDPFKGLARSYGMFRNVRNYLACVIDPSFDNAEERAGFYAEKIVMCALQMGLGSCFVGGTFSREHSGARMRVYEKLPFVVTLGYPADKGESFMARMTSRIAHRKTRGARFFFDGDDAEFARAEELFPDLMIGLEALACAPSGLNRQPVRVRLDDNGMLRAYADACAYNAPVDLGIGKFNFAAAAGGSWEWGEDAPFIPGSQV